MGERNTTIQPPLHAGYKRTGLHFCPVYFHAIIKADNMYQQLDLCRHPKCFKQRSNPEKARVLR